MPILLAFLVMKNEARARKTKKTRDKMGVD
jgi:hypothetical protein